MRSIEAVVFDFGGVMTNTTMPERVRHCVRELGIDWSILEAGFARYRRLMDGNFLSLEEMYDQIWADADVQVSPEVSARIQAEDFASFLEDCRNERTRDWMRELKAAGYKIGILSNMSTVMAERFRRVYADYVETADAQVISGEERMFKPQARIYRRMAERLECAPERICFIDDVETNCAGARAVGWQAIRFVNNAQVEADFNRGL